MSKFAFCRPGNGVIWCQWPNGSWAPPIPMTVDINEKSPMEISKSDNSEEEKPES